MVESETPVVLTREAASKEGVLPTGRKVGIVHVKGTSMYELAYVDSKGGPISDEYRGRFTSLHYAQRELQRYVDDLWDISDRAASRSKKTLTLSQPNAIS